MIKHRLISLVVVIAALCGAPAAASAASFHTNEPGAAIAGAQTESIVLTIQGQQVICKTVTATGTAPASGTAEILEVQPAFSECTAFGFAGATIESQGCRFAFNANPATIGLNGCEKGGLTLRVQIPFIATCHVTVTGGIGGQVNYLNRPDRKSLTLIAGAFLSAHVITSTGLCPLTVGTWEAGLQGRLTLEGKKSSTELWVE